MKSKMHILIPVLVLALVVTAGDSAQAGMFGRSKQKDAKQLKAWRYDRLPTMGFARGTVSQGAFTGWEMNDLQVVISKKCTIINGKGEPTELRGGAEVVIMGPRMGGSIVAWQIRVLDAAYLHDGVNPAETVEWSEADPTLGVGFGPN